VDKPLKEFNPVKGTNRRNAWCKDCHSKAYYKWRTDNKERLKEWQTQYDAKRREAKRVWELNTRTGNPNHLARKRFLRKQRILKKQDHVSINLIKKVLQ
jgi:hypothetical protein